MTANLNTEIAKLWADGMSASVIGEHLGISRGAIMGRISRMKLPPRETASRKGRSGNVVACGASKPKPTISHKPTPPSRTFAPAPPPPSLEMIFRAAEKDGCRWMSGDPREMLFCGEVAVRGGSYCSVHHARAYRAVAA